MRCSSVSALPAVVDEIECSLTAVLYGCVGIKQLRAEGCLSKLEYEELNKTTIARIKANSSSEAFELTQSHLKVFYR